MERLERVLSEVADRPAHEIVESVMAHVAGFTNGAPQSDDITCAALARADN
jgi:serine phosphatase RsbU (regulator of sigma subunit)